MILGRSPLGRRPLGLAGFPVLLPPAPAATIDVGLWLLLQGSTPVVVPYDLYEAAVAWLRANAASSLPGGVHSGLAPADSAALGAYAQVVEVGETESYVSGGTAIQAGLLQVSTFAATRAAAKRAGDAVRDSLKDAHLTFARGAIYRLRPAGPRMLMAPSAATLGGENLYHDVRQFAYLTVTTS